MSATNDEEASSRLVFITGPAGAGRTTALKALEDLGFETIDNLPLALVPRLLDGAPMRRPLALAVDPRTRDFDIPALLAHRDLLARQGIAATLVYLDCDAPTLRARFIESRRKHPLAPQGRIEEGIARELDLLGPLREVADIAIDTAQLSPYALRRILQECLVGEAPPEPLIDIISFAYGQGLPAGLDFVFDCRLLRNPHWNDTLRPLTGRDEEVQAYVGSDPLHDQFRNHVMGLLAMTCERAREEGRASVSLGFGCTGGRHRSVAMAEMVGKALAKEGRRVSIRHRELQADKDN